MSLYPIGGAVAHFEPPEHAAVKRRTGREDHLLQQVEKLLAKARLAVIHAGNREDEGAVIFQTLNTRSWKSYESVAHDISAALRRVGARHVSVMPEDMRLGERLRQECTHMAWLNTGGVQGYDPVCHAPAMLELFGIPYIGHDPLVASTLDNKHAFKRELQAFGLPTARFMTWHMRRGGFDVSSNDRFSDVFGDYEGPFVVKPVSGRASLHVHAVAEREGLGEVVAEVYEATHNHVLIEEFLSGREFCIAVGGPVVFREGNCTRLPGPFAFSALERVLQPDEMIFTSMDVRPITGERFRVLHPETDGPLIDNLSRLACEVFEDLNLETLVRMDIREDANGKLHVLEANPKPDLKAPSTQQTNLVCAGLDQVGMSYDDLVLSILADRVDLLFGQRRGTAHHLLALLE